MSLDTTRQATETAWKSEVEWRRVQLRTEALRVTGQIMTGALDVEGSTPQNTRRAALDMAETFAEWLETGERL